MTASIIPEEVLRLALLGELAVAFLALSTLAIHGLWLWRRLRADAPRLAQGHLVLSALVDSDLVLDRPAVAELSRLPRRLQRKVVQQLAVNVTGEDGDRLASVAELLGLVGAAERLCRSRWWWRRLLGAHELNVYGRGEMLPQLFDDPHPAVRAQVIEWAGDSGVEEMTTRLVLSLQDPSPLCRNTAADSLLRAGAPMLGAIARELSSRSGPRQADLLEVLARRPDPRYHKASIVAVADAMPAIRAAAAAVLGGTGGSEAASALMSLLSDTDASVRAAAADGLRSLGHQEAAPALAPLLRDQSFVVRRTAAAALAALGPGGTLLLRHHLSDEDPFAADMARYTLDVAALGLPGTIATSR